MSLIHQPESRPGPGRHFLNAPVWLWLAFAGVGLIFTLLPQLDLAASSLFYTPGVGFAARGTWFERLVHQSTYWFLVLGTPALVGLWLAHRRGWLRGFGIGGRDLAFLLLVLVLGPGLLVNGILKEHWGRVRPLNCQEFGGTGVFTPAFVPSDQGGAPSVRVMPLAPAIGSWSPWYWRPGAGSGSGWPWAIASSSPGRAWPLVATF
jgi:hypothetical protein